MFCPLIAQLFSCVSVLLFEIGACWLKASVPKSRAAAPPAIETVMHGDATVTWALTVPESALAAGRAESAKTPVRGRE
jgi:hypothetical protein